MPAPQNLTRLTKGREFSTTKGTPAGMQVNLHGLNKLIAGVTGDMLAPILVSALEPAEVDARANWPVLTGASIDTIKIVVVEVGPRHARVNLQVGGPALIADSRNTSGKDYAPYIEFNGSPAGRGQGAMVNAFYGNEREMKRIVREGVAQLIRELTL